MRPIVRFSSARGRLPSTAPTVIRRKSCSSRSFDPDPDAVAEQLRPRAVAEHAIRGFAQAELLGRMMPESADALGQAGYPVGVRLPPPVGDELARVTKASAPADLLEMLVLWPARGPGGDSQPLPRFAPGLQESRERRVDLGLDERRDVVVAGRKDASVPENPRRLGQDGLRLHPVERLKARDQIGAAVRQARLRTECLDVTDVRLRGGDSCTLEHAGVRLDPYDLVGAFRPRPGREAGAAPQVDDETRPLDAGHDRQDVEHLAWGRGAVAVIDVREAFVEVSRTPDQLLRERRHGTTILVVWSATSAMLPGPRSRGARVHAHPSQGCKPCLQAIAASGLVLATQEAGNVTDQTTRPPVG